MDGNSGNTTAACLVMVNDSDQGEMRRSIDLVDGTLANGEVGLSPGCTGISLVSLD
jgi:hypothetical protein